MTDANVLMELNQLIKEEEKSRKKYDWNEMWCLQFTCVSLVLIVFNVGDNSLLFSVVV